jgi:hypothetical protein
MQVPTVKIKNQAGHALIVNVCDYPQWKARGYVELAPVPEAPKTDGDGEKVQAKGTDSRNEPQPKGQARQK